jgi:hypothetical protein
MISKIAIGSTATLVSAAKERNWLMLQNQSDVAVFLSFDGTTAVTTDSGASPGIRLAPWESITSDDSAGRFTGNNLPIYAIHGSAGEKYIAVHEA